VSETLQQSMEGPGRRMRLFSAVGLWLLVVSSLTASPVQACQWHPTDARTGVLESPMQGISASISAQAGPSESDPKPAGHHQGTDECCCPAPCGGLSGLTSRGIRSAMADADPGLGPTLLPDATGPVVSVEPFLLPFAIPPPLSA